MWRLTLGRERYAQVFAENEVDLDAPAARGIIREAARRFQKVRVAIFVSPIMLSSLMSIESLSLNGSGLRRVATI